ncbi:MAG: GNAT family N-acetyltransferase [Alphaproteobacteria bacterium]|nr:MAG: GNAT family N-acetyltransferase [Alphaproteobacteria bacterium]
MFRIRTLTDASAPANQKAIGEIQAIIRDQFSEMPEKDIAKLPDQISDPITHQFVAKIAVAEDGRGHIRGFSVLLVDPQLKFGYLELIATAKGGSGGGVGAALYEQIRIRAREKGLEGLYFECLPDDPALSPNPALRKQNEDRLRFYEGFGAYPITGTDYETPVTPGTFDSPYLVFDSLGAFDLPKAPILRRIIRAVLERKYADLCPPEYVDRVTKSVQDKKFALRGPCYGSKRETKKTPVAAAKIPLIVNDRHDIHHIRERGYVEAPVRIKSILKELEPTGLFAVTAPKHFGDTHIKAVHDPRLVDYIERACADAPEGKSIYPYVFPLRNAERMPKDRSVLAGYWCIDTFTPLNRNAYPAARRAVDCTLTAAEAVLNGARSAYALIRPPGHHAEAEAFGGFCYFNNSAVAAQYLSRYGRVAVLDVDYHHGNGTQDIFYERGDVLTVSIHGDPSFAYPYFTGFRNETGQGAGAGCNLNLPLPEVITAEDHRDALKRAFARIAEHAPAYLVVALGLDAAKGDPTGTWPYRAADFTKMGAMIGGLDLPTVFVQEGGYRIRNLGVNARHFFEGVASVSNELGQPWDLRHAGGKARNETLKWRRTVVPADVAEIRRIVMAANAFSGEEIAIATELAEERIAKGPSSGYEFILASQNGKLAGYACYGKTPGSEQAYDLYWLAVDPDRQRSGLGHQILARVDKAVADAGGTFMIAETSSTSAYDKARAFYVRTGFEKLVEIRDFYRPGDNKVIYRKGCGGL